MGRTSYLMCGAVQNENAVQYGQYKMKTRDPLFKMVQDLHLGQDSSSQAEGPPSTDLGRHTLAPPPRDSPASQCSFP